MANPQDLEDFAAGLGGGAYSPQQGSVLPNVGAPPAGPSALGMPPSAPPPQPSFPAVQQPPLRSLGGAPPQVDVGALLNQRLQSVQGFNPQTSTWAQKGDYYRMLHELPALAQVAGIKSQDQQLQQKYLQDVGTTLKEYNALGPNERTAQGPLFERLLTAHTKLAGLPVEPGHIKEALTSPNVGGTYSDIINDPLIPQEQKAGLLNRIGSAPAGEKRDAAATLVRKEVEAQATSLVQTHLPQIVASMGGNSNKPVAVGDIMANPQVKEFLDSSPITKRVFNAYINNKDNAEGLANLGVDVSAKKRQEQQAEGPKMTAIGSSFLSSMFTDENGKPLIPAKASSQQIGEALKAEAAFEIRKAAEQGLTTKKYELQLPASAEERDKHIDVGAFLREGQLIKPPAGISVGDLRTGDYRYASPQQQEKLTALTPTRQQLDTFQALSDRLVTAKTPVEAFEQGIKLTLGAKSGSNAVAKAYADASEGFIGNLSRTLGGERGVLTDADRAVMRKAAISSFFDTQTSKDIKKAIINDMYDAAHQATASEITGKGSVGAQTSRVKELLRKLDDATNESLSGQAKLYMKTHPGEQVVQDEKGNMGVIRKGMTVPKGYKVIE